MPGAVLAPREFETRVDLVVEAHHRLAGKLERGAEVGPGGVVDQRNFPPAGSSAGGIKVVSWFKGVAEDHEYLACRKHHRLRDLTADGADGFELPLVADGHTGKLGEHGRGR